MTRSTSRIISIFLLLLALAAAPSLAGAIPRRAAKRSCTNPIIRKEWRSLTTRQKVNYINAVQCLQNKLPAITSATVPGAVTRFEDFIGVHKIQAPYVHWTGHFLPWHRYLMWTYEKVLREQCDYDGAQPYWDYTIDQHNFLASPIFDPVIGFGGDGNPNTTSHCLHDGPFANWTIHLADSTSTGRGDRCLSRLLNATLASEWFSQAKEDEILQQQDYGWMVETMERTGQMSFHGAGHFAIGGSDGDIYTSSSEPLFYLHHTNLDRIWAQWQAMNPFARLTDISGSIKPRFNILPYSGVLPAGNVTLDFKMNLGALGGEITVGDVMDPLGGFLCYVYL